MVNSVRKSYPGLTEETLKSGKKRLRVRVEGNRNKKITLLVNLDHPKFSEHYCSARDGVQLPAEPESKAPRRSIQWLVDKFLIHLENQVEAGLYDQKTFRQKKSQLNRVCKFKRENGDLYGEMNIAAPPHAFVAVRDSMAKTPAEADNTMKSLRVLYDWAIENGKIEYNPVIGIKKIYVNKGGATPWTADDLKQFKKRHPLGTMAHLALTLHMFTGCRANDACWLGRDQEFTYQGRKWLGWQPRKKNSKYVELPVLPPLRNALNASVLVGGAYLLNAHGQPFKTANSYRTWFRKRVDEAGLKNRSSHGIRKALAELLAEEKCSNHQIMAVLSHSKASTTSIYTEGAQRRVLSASAFEAVESLNW